MTDATPRSFLPRPLRVVAGRALETALNHVLSLDPDTIQRLEALDGRSVQLTLDGPGLALAITVEQGRLKVGPAADDSHLRVRASPGSLLAMALRRDEDGVSPGKVDIAGDADLARRLEKLASKFAPDFEEAFARTFGDVLGVPLAKAVRKALEQAKRSASHLTEDTADWLRDEIRVAMAPGEVEGFLDGVDALRERSERLEARLARLERQAKGSRA
ncbi:MULTISPECIES: ubiquinone biosynthesis accessory factor UbiJ [Dyella]|uniref:Ubiquinone biosynthesis accessory factor UbiJ n=2 Tax=Dyella TaxID=231454 RepID=A0A4R0YIR8_9GAMM|nr:MULTISPECIES: SCP2 sterol-binding domain-containing protein [Dyella]TBR36568.1 sterol-binding protein [Dyella terrae]TCI08340.1 sterol-binding protein [Dyella soli]